MTRKLSSSSQELADEKGHDKSPKGFFW